MKMNVYSVYDEMTEQYKYPIFLPNDKVAIYYFKKDMVKQDDELRNSSLLCLVGSFDNDTGKIEPVEISVIYRGVDCGIQSNTNT